MKKPLVVLALFGLFCIPALAKNVPQVEIFGGYQFLHQGDEEIDVDGEPIIIPSFNYHGFTAAFEDNVTSYFGIVGEFGYFRHTEMPGEGIEATLSGVPFLFGPRFSYRSDKVRIFGHYLLGGARLKFDTTPNYVELEGIDTFFTQAVGGGIDAVVNKYLSIRPIQIDLVSIRLTEGGRSNWNHHFRYSGGVVLKLGSK